MKSDEVELLRILQQKQCSGGDTILPYKIAHSLGMNEKRAEYIFLKWTGKGWYDYGIHCGQDGLHLLAPQHAGIAILA